MWFCIKLFSKLLGSYKAYFSVTLFSPRKHDYRIFVSLFAHWWLRVCQHLPPSPWGQYLTWGICDYFGKVFWFRATSITSIDLWNLFDTLLPEKLVFPSKMNVDLKFVFRSIVQVYQRFKDISIFTHTFLSSDDFVHHHDGVLYKFRYCEISGAKGEFWFV